MTACSTMMPYSPITSAISSWVIGRGVVIARRAVAMETASAKPMGTCSSRSSPSTSRSTITG